MKCTLKAGIGGETLVIEGWDTEDIARAVGFAREAKDKGIGSLFIRIGDHSEVYALQKMDDAAFTLFAYELREMLKKSEKRKV